MKNTKHKGIYLKLNEVNDKDIIERLDAQHSEGNTKQGYIKELIRTDAALDCLRHSFDNGLTKVEEKKEG